MNFKVTFQLTNVNTGGMCKLTLPRVEGETKSKAAFAARKVLKKHFPSYRMRLSSARINHAPTKGTEDAVRKTPRSVPRAAAPSPAGRRSKRKPGSEPVHPPSGGEGSGPRPHGREEGTPCPTPEAQTLEVK